MLSSKGRNTHVVISIIYYTSFKILLSYSLIATPIVHMHTTGIAHFRIVRLYTQPCGPLIITNLPVITADAFRETLDVCCKLKGLIAIKHFMAAVAVKPSHSKDNKAFYFMFYFYVAIKLVCF